MASIAQSMNQNLTRSLAENLRAFKDILRMPRNKDVIVREFTAGDFQAAVLCMDGMANTDMIDENILKPVMRLEGPVDCDEQDRCTYLVYNVVSVAPAGDTQSCDEGLQAVLDGQTLLLCDGCDLSLIHI